MIKSNFPRFRGRNIIIRALYKGQFPGKGWNLEYYIYHNICCSQAIYQKMNCSWKLLTIDFNPFPHINAFGRLCSRRLFENIVTKEEIAQNVQFLLLPQCLPLFVIGYPFNYGDFLCLDKIRSKSSAAELLYEGKG